LERTFHPEEDDEFFLNPERKLSGYAIIVVAIINFALYMI
jgi:hypothetical protein